MLILLSYRDFSNKVVRGQTVMILLYTTAGIKIKKIKYSIYRRSSGYNGFDLCCFEITKAFHINIKDDNIEAVKVDYCDQELQ